MLADGVVFLPSFHESIKDLPDEERLGVYDAIVRYGLYGEVVEMTPLVKSLFVLIKPVIDSSQNRYRAAKENGKKGGRPPKSQTQNQIGNHTTNYDTDSEKDLAFDSENNKEKDSERTAEREEERLRGEERTKLAYKPLTEDSFEKERQRQLAKLGY